ncbi:MAG: alpha-glucosidase [Candidatus Korobacteraceae bacterium]|jgi:alpha-glucosidase
MSKRIFVLFLLIGSWAGRPAGAQSEGPATRLSAPAAQAKPQAKASATKAKSSAAPSKAAAADAHHWWQNAVFYEIYTRSFADSNNDGIGDLNGITSKLDYLHEMGVDAIWLTPFFPSPQVDFGYDVTDYENIDALYGNLSDFGRLQSGAEQRDIRVVLDLVMDRTSDQHQWFIDARSSRNAKHRDWYVWHDGKGANQPPNNWLSVYGGPAWTLDPKTNQYYYHVFFPQQPELNWRNPAVKDAMFDVTRFWYDRGVRGFRLDAVDALFADAKLRDNAVLADKNNNGDANMDEPYDRNLGEIQGVLKGLRKIADEYDAVLIGESWTSSVDQLKQYYGAERDELELPMNLMFTMVKQLSPGEFRKQIAALNAAGGWPVYMIGNHNVERSYSRYGDGKHNDAIAKVMAGMYLTLRGTPIMYYGEEIGMENNDPKAKAEVKDPKGKQGWPQEKGRDGERTPMQWTDTVNAGFSKTRPWLPVAANYKTHNVASELKDPNSILLFYRRLLELRRTTPALLEGAYVVLNESDPNVMSYLRTYKDKAVLVVINMSGEAQKARFDLTPQGFSTREAETLLTTMSGVSGNVRLSEMTLEPFAVYMGEVGR